jgi:hypothetical protein
MDQTGSPIDRAERLRRHDGLIASLPRRRAAARWCADMVRMGLEREDPGVNEAVRLDMVADDGVTRIPQGHDALALAPLVASSVATELVLRHS